MSTNVQTLKEKPRGRPRGSGSKQGGGQAQGRGKSRKTQEESVETVAAKEEELLKLEKAAKKRMDDRVEALEAELVEDEHQTNQLQTEHDDEFSELDASDIKRYEALRAETCGFGGELEQVR
ncbi:hypothetical protein FB45DRAFT_1028409 [Roridomyces roridus]|uniref:Uncharacterized protein n=1 Tax=Roridomyces roridus TaxID=1738132 RepID=A0AAD7FJJ9_9AGAR|nr:hypothetical protein FB45DRAFT_1028409 [Roridomyces roridus]